MYVKRVVRELTPGELPFNVGYIWRWLPNRRKLFTSIKIWTHPFIDMSGWHVDITPKHQMYIYIYICINWQNIFIQTCFVESTANWQFQRNNFQDEADSFHVGMKPVGRTCLNMYRWPVFRFIYIPKYRVLYSMGQKKQRYIMYIYRCFFVPLNKTPCI